MRTQNHELSAADNDIPALYELGELLRDDPEALRVYDRAKINQFGIPDLGRRQGEYPWPMRNRNGVEYTYSTQVLAGVSAEKRRMLYVGKDPWQDGPDSWLVTVINLESGIERDISVLNVSIEEHNDKKIWIQLAPPGSENLPPADREALARQPRYAQMRIEGYLDERAHMEHAEVRDGLGRPVINYEDFRVLEAMLVVAQEARASKEGGLRPHVASRAVSAAMSEV